MTNSEKLKAKKEEKTFDFDFGIEILSKLIELKEFSVNIFFICLHEIRILPKNPFIDQKFVRLRLNIQGFCRKRDKYKILFVIQKDGKPLNSFLHLLSNFSPKKWIQFIFR